MKFAREESSSELTDVVYLKFHYKLNRRFGIGNWEPEAGGLGR